MKVEAPAELQVTVPVEAEAEVERGAAVEAGVSHLLRVQEDVEAVVKVEVEVVDEIALAAMIAVLVVDEAQVEVPVEVAHPVNQATHRMHVVTEKSQPSHREDDLTLEIVHVSADREVCPVATREADHRLHTSQRRGPKAARDHDRALFHPALDQDHPENVVSLDRQVNLRESKPNHRSLVIPESILTNQPQTAIFLNIASSSHCDS